MSTKIYFDIDKNGQIVGQFDSAPPANDALNIVHSVPPPESMLKPRWLGDANNGQWFDAATRTEHEAHIDAKTDASIQTWCRDKCKNEAYYLNRGIAHGKGDREYKEYRAFVEKQKQIAAIEKKKIT